MDAEEKREYIEIHIRMYEPTCKEVYDFADEYFTYHPIKLKARDIHELFEEAAEATERTAEWTLEHLIDTDTHSPHLYSLQQAYTNYLVNQYIINNLDLYTIDPTLFREIAEDEIRLEITGLVDPSEYLTDKAWQELIERHTIKA